MQLIRCLLSNFCLNMFRATLCPSSGEQDRVLLHMVFCIVCAGCGCVELGRKPCALIRCILSNFCLNMFRATLCPSSREQDLVLLHMVFCTGCAVCGCVELGRKLWAHGFIIKLLSRHVSGIIMPIIRRTRPCITAYGVLHWLCWLWVLVTGCYCEGYWSTETFISTCFGHHCDHHQESKNVYYCIWCSALVMLAVVVCSWVVNCVYCVHSNLNTVHTA